MDLVLQQGSVRELSDSETVATTCLLTLRILLLLFLAQQFRPHIGEGRQQPRKIPLHLKDCWDSWGLTIFGAVEREEELREAGGDKMSVLFNHAYGDD